MDPSTVFCVTSDQAQPGPEWLALGLRSSGMVRYRYVSATAWQHPSGFPRRAADDFCKRGVDVDDVRERVNVVAPFHDRQDGVQEHGCLVSDDVAAQDFAVWRDE
jgi:hypothetical protein